MENYIVEVLNRLVIVIPAFLSGFFIALNFKKEKD